MKHDKNLFYHVAERILSYSVMAFLTFLTLVPFYGMFVLGTYESNNIFNFNLLPSDYILNNINTIFSEPLFATFFKNSFFVSLFSVVFGILSCTLCGYGLAKFNFKGRNFFYKLILFSMMIPSQLGIITYIWEMKVLHLNNSLTPVIIPFICIGFGAFWMTQYIKDTVPNEMIESARIDSANEFQIFTRIVIHLVKPAVFTLSLLILIWSWNSFFVPLVAISDANLFTIPLGVSLFSAMFSVDNGAKILALSFATIPVLIIYLVFSNKLVSGLMAGAIKG